LVDLSVDLSFLDNSVVVSENNEFLKNIELSFLFFIQTALYNSNKPETFTFHAQTSYYVTTADGFEKLGNCRRRWRLCVCIGGNTWPSRKWAGTGRAGLVI